MIDLVIDWGNTRIKFGIIQDKKLIHTKTLQNTEIDLFTSEIEKLELINACILSSVANIEIEIIDFIKSKCISFFEFTHNTKIPIDNKYKTPETLGKDRLSAVIGAWSLFPNENILVIDAGTCIKFDLVTKNSEYFGGSISPGLQMRFKALNFYTDKLPLVAPENIEYYIGTTTKESILSGVINGIIAELNGIISNYQKDYENLRIILTGGDAFFFEKKLKNIIFANSNLLIIGLNEILQHNV